jgi:hypothetical protein
VEIHSRDDLDFRCKHNNKTNVRFWMYIWSGHIIASLRQWTVGWEYMEVGQVLKLLNSLEFLLAGRSKIET